MNYVVICVTSLFLARPYSPEKPGLCLSLSPLCSQPLAQHVALTLIVSFALLKNPVRGVCTTQPIFQVRKLKFRELKRFAQRKG